MKRKGQPPMSPEQQQQQQELNQLNAISNRINKLNRKFQSDLDPVQDKIDALNELQLLVQNYVNEIVNERDTFKSELRVKIEQNKLLQEELDELKKQLDPNITAEPVEPEPEPEPEKKAELEATPEPEEKKD